MEKIQDLFGKFDRNLDSYNNGCGCSCGCSCGCGN